MSHGHESDSVTAPIYQTTAEIDAAPRRMGSVQNDEYVEQL